MIGTNFFTPLSTTVKVALSDENGKAALIRCTAANLPTDAGYAVGCIAPATDTGAFYTNTGTTSVASFTLISSSSVTLATALTDSSTTTGTSLSATYSAITTGTGISSINGNTTNFTTGASLFKADLSSATAGNGLVITGSGAYAGTGLISLSATAMTTGTGILMASSEAALTTGKYMNLGTVFTVAKYGATVIAGNAATTVFTITAGHALLSSGNLTLTSGNLVLTSGNATLTSGNLTLTSGSITLTANSSVITCTGTGTNGMLLTNLYNDTAKTMSGTARTIEIMLGATPYYFLVYPTAS